MCGSPRVRVPVTGRLGWTSRDSGPVETMGDSETQLEMGTGDPEGRELFGTPTRDSGSPKSLK